MGTPDGPAGLSDVAGLFAAALDDDHAVWARAWDGALVRVEPGTDPAGLGEQLIAALAGVPVDPAASPAGHVIEVVPRQKMDAVNLYGWRCSCGRSSGMIGSASRAGKAGEEHAAAMKFPPRDNRQRLQQRSRR